MKGYVVKAILSSILLVGISAGCGVIPSPEETIQPPATPGAPTQEDRDELRDTLLELLPEGAELVAPAADGESERASILLDDLNGDGVEEALLVYRTADQASSLQAVLFSQYEGEWSVLWEETGQGYDLDYMDMVDLDGDGYLELVFGWTIGASAGSGLDIYGWVDGQIEWLDQTAYNLLDIQDIGQNGQTNGETGKVIALWIKDTGNVFDVELLRLREKQLVRAPDMETLYFPNVVSYYEELVEEMPESKILWYYLADAQLKAGDKDKALESIDAAKKLDSDNYLDERLLRLEHQVRETVDYVLEHTRIGRTQEEILELFGEQYEEVIPGLESPGVVGMWRYDAVIEESYEYDTGFTPATDSVDIEGIREGKLRYQLFVSWREDGAAHSYTLYYLENNRVHEYRLWNDGGESVNEIG
ncbi:FG-GAP repeat domain-containing protein [Bacillus horti]|uniref:Tetratricopeptide (TPR) repeat protein n=1 Tax=Caldalkalibacillus horti TaxID=77523 RepID=A0ABT9VZ20_9BACI|nr:VCBS repeat-containing protein [Bacillus horti]MDQ0166214.1 tetratricopeptide (TPR) repeat protein [Bacillus horti]